MEPESRQPPTEPPAEGDPPFAAIGSPEARTEAGAARGRNTAVETVFAALTAALFFALFLLFRYSAFPAFAFAAVPLVRVAYRHGLLAGLLGAAAAVGMLAAIGAASGGASDAEEAGVLAAIAIGLPVLVAGVGRSRLSASGAFLVLAVIGAPVLVGAVYGLVEMRVGGHSVSGEIAAAFDAVTPPTGDATVKGVDPDVAARTAAMILRFKVFSENYWPGLGAVFWVLMAAVAFYVGAFTARPAPSAETTRFEQLRVPAAAVGLFVASGAGFALLPNPGRAVAVDVLLPLLALYFLTGLSIICHFARRWFRARILRAGLYALVVYFPLNVGVGLLGLFDWYADFRHRGEKAGGKA